MYFSRILTVTALLTVLDTTAANPQRNKNNPTQNPNQGPGSGNGGNNTEQGADAQLTLNSNAVQSASNSDGAPTGGQAASQKDPANFINFCAGKVLTNGKQIAGGSCNGIVMGDLPAQSNMISSIILNPKPGDNLDANKQFTVSVRVANLQAGKFTNPQDTYYAAPQTLENGRVVGHTHITIQDLGGSLSPQQAPDASKFVFFKGIDDSGDGSGTLSATVANGLPAGSYRVCTMTSSSNHQPVLMPVAQRGAQDDCTKFTVGQSQGSKNRGTNDPNAGDQPTSEGSDATNQNGGNNARSNSSQNTRLASTASTNGQTSVAATSTSTRRDSQRPRSTGISSSNGINSGQNVQNQTSSSEANPSSGARDGQGRQQRHQHQNQGRTLKFVG